MPITSIAWKANIPYRKNQLFVSPRDEMNSTFWIPDRIYDNLPEVKKKQEEKQKRIIIQSNRLRVEMFKKQLLDQLLHRNTEWQRSLLPIILIGSWMPLTAR